MSNSWHGEQGTSRISYHIFNNKTGMFPVCRVPEELKMFFRKGSDCAFGKVVPRPIPAEVTGKGRNSAETRPATP